MSLMRCHRHDETWDSDFSQFCPRCEILDIEVTQAENGWAAHFASDPDDKEGVAWGYATTEDDAIDNLLRVA